MLNQRRVQLNRYAGQRRLPAPHAARADAVRPFSGGGAKRPQDGAQTFIEEEKYMSTVKKVVIVAAGIILGIVGLLIGGIVLWGWPTHGDRIEQYENPQQALLVIDIQEDYTGTTAQPPFPFEDSEQLIATVNTIIEESSKRNTIIVYIRQEFDGLWGTIISEVISGGTAIKGSPGAEIDERISVLSSHVYSKPKPDAFSNAELEAFLVEHQVNELYLVGLAAEGCVRYTALGALDRGYDVNIITDAVILRDEEKREKLLQQYREDGITLLSGQQFMEQTP
jgi:nicotinamidase-related amidase